MSKRAHNFVDHAGRRYGKITVSRFMGSGPSGTAWEGVCECGSVKTYRVRDLQTGHTQSCGCQSRDFASLSLSKHGEAGRNKSREYRAWAAAINRCTNPRATRYERWGGRGIRVCDRWLGSFENFLADMGRCPLGHSLDRIDNDGNYEPSNCRWASVADQNRNSRQCIRLSFQGQTKTISEWERALGFSFGVLRRRIKKGWPIEQALTAPIGAKA